MRKILSFFIFFISFLSSAQTDYSAQWEDLFSYNNVKKIVPVENRFYALSDNAVFVYDATTQETRKISSINGLSGEETSAMHYSEEFNRLVIGYESGLIEILDEDGRITVSPDIVNFNQSGIKRINDIYEYDQKLYLTTPFAVIVYDIENLEFGDTYFIGAGSSAVNTKEVVVSNNQIYVSSENGIYTADVTNPNLIDATNWTLRFAGNYNHLVNFGNRVFATSNTALFSASGSSINQVLSFPEDIIDMSATDENLVISLNKRALMYNTSLNVIAEQNTTSDFDFSLNTATTNNSEILLGTKEYGVLSSQIASTSYQEIHPEGPLTNSAFSIDVHNNNLWVVYGGYDATYTPSFFKQGFSHYNGETWNNTPFDPNNPFPDLVHVTIDKNKENSVFISGTGGTNQLNTMLTGGLLKFENNEVTTFYNQLNSPLEDIEDSNPSYATIRVSGTTFDREGNLWVTNIGGDQRIKKLSPSGQWTGYDINELYLVNRFGMNEIVVDNSNSKWIGTRGNGVYIFNENGDRKRSFTTEINKGNLPNLNVRTVAVDKRNRIWLGTLSGMVVYNNAGGVFDADIYNAEPIIILDDGTPKKLLGDQTINSITVDGADNKWFGTDSGGVLYTNPNGQTTLARFDTNNSPLPSNRIVKIKVDDSTGKVYFATDKGMVAYNSNVSPFGDELGEVYAYPNPVLNTHDTVTIDGRNGTNLPKGTNIKILDVAGNLVYETNVVEGEQVQGGKAVWNKRNLAGNKVASGVYIVLLSNEDGSETATTKIAIVN